MKIDGNFLNLVKDLSEKQNHVFNEQDLQILFNQKLDQSFYRSYQKLHTLGIIDRFSKGIYVTEGFKLVDVNKKINQNSYISFEYVLAFNSLIGTYSNKLLRSVICSGRTKQFVYRGHYLEQFKICEGLFFGFDNKDGLNVATPEKAYLDCLYFYTKGLKFSFDLFSDVDLNLLDHHKIFQYLKKYKNKKFVSFVKGILKSD